MKPDAQHKEFALAGSLSLMRIAGIATAIGLGGVVIIAALFAAGIIGTEGALAGTVVNLALAAGIAGNFMLLGRGTVTVTPDRLEVRTKLGKAFYRWSHIDTIELVQPSGAWPQLMTLWTAPRDRPMVRIGLSRSLRAGLMDRSGTDTFGIPSLVAKTVLLNVDDLEGLVREVHSYLQAPQR